MTDFAALRAQFPVLRDLVYLQAGTCGPIAQPAADAAIEEIRAATRDGRFMDHFGRMVALEARQRAAYAARLRAQPEQIALTTSTSEGIVRVLAGLRLGPGDQVITSEEEHPGLFGPLADGARQFGYSVRVVGLADVADAVSSATKLVAVSHVSWINGALAPTALAELPDDVPLLLDGAQGAGAIDVDVCALRCEFYAAAGQKWMCGPIGSGMLYVAPEWAERLPSIGPTYMNLETPADGIEARPHRDARRHDSAALSAEAAAFAVAAHDTLDATGWPAVHERATGLAASLAEGLRERGKTVAGRGATTLVSWEEDDPAATKERLLAAGVVVRDLPGYPYVRASVGAWNDESDRERLLAAL